MPFDETLTPEEPVRVGPLPGEGVSLARDPIEGSLFALLSTDIGDFHVVELTRGWIREALRSGDPVPEPRVLFSLQEWMAKLEDGDVAAREIPFPVTELPARLSAIRTEALDFIAFDELGSLYMGAEEQNLVLKFELARPSGRYAVGVAAGVVERGPDLAPHVKFHAWKKSTLGYR